MRTRIAFVAAALLAAGGAVTALRSQEAFQPPKPGKEHDILKEMQGTWDAVVKMSMDPNTPPVESKSVETATLGGNGLWLISDVKGDFMGMPFHGHGMFGYDTAKKKYVGSWVDSMGTYILQSEGTYDVEKKTFNWTSEVPDPASGKMEKMRELHAIKGKDHRSSSIFVIGPDGKEKPMMTIEFRRRK